MAGDEVTLPRFQSVKSSSLHLIYNSICLGIIVYVIIYGIGIKKRYQTTDIGYGTVMTTVMGIVDTRNRIDLEPEDVYRRIWESADLVESFQENGALFITTNAIITPRQKLGNCSEDPSILPAHCTPTDTKNCLLGYIQNLSNGIMTGNCVPTTFLNSTPTYTCEVNGWCPTERMVMRQNTPPDVDDAMLAYKCIKQNRIDNPKDYSCPVFRLSYMLEKAGMLDTFENVTALEGGTLSVTIKWNCNFDHWHNETCKPEYIFRQLDITDSAPISSYDFRDGRTYRENGVLTRDLYKVFGIFLIFNIEAKASKLDYINTLLELSAAFGLFKLATSVSIKIIEFAASLKKKENESAMKDVNPKRVNGRKRNFRTASDIPTLNCAIVTQQPADQRNEDNSSHSEENISTKKFIVAELQECSLTTKSWIAGIFDPSLKWKICISFFGVGLTFIIIIVGINSSSLIIDLLAYFSVSIAPLMVIYSFLWCLPERSIVAFFDWLSNRRCIEGITIIACLIILLAFLAYQVLLMNLFSLADIDSFWTFLAGIPAVGFIDIIVVMSLHYLCLVGVHFVRFAYYSYRMLRSYVCHSQYECWPHNDIGKEFVEHMYNISKGIFMVQEEKPEEGQEDEKEKTQCRKEEE